MLGQKSSVLGQNVKILMPSPFLTIPRARSMIWPGSQQTMGELLDQDKLSCKIREYIDEAFAVKVADNGVFSKKRFCQFVTCEIM